MSKCVSPLLVRGQQVPCGKCYFCLNERRASWDFRLLMEELQCSSSYFLTFTYDDEHLPFYYGSPSLDKRHITKFFQDLRNYCRLKLGHVKSLFKYFVIGEYGGQFGRPHYHLLLFLYDGFQFDDIPIFDIWKYGNIKNGRITIKSIHYVTKFHVYPKFREHNGVPPFSMMSKGIGIDYISQYDSDYIPSTIRYNGNTFPFPRYYRKKLTSLIEDYEPPLITSYLDHLKRKHPDYSVLELSQLMARVHWLTDKKLKNYNNHSNLSL